MRESQVTWPAVVVRYSFVSVSMYVNVLRMRIINYCLKSCLCVFKTGYRDDSLETVKRNEMQYEIPLRIFSYKELYGWTMDEIVSQVESESE